MFDDFDLSGMNFDYDPVDLWENVSDSASNWNPASAYSDISSLASSVNDWMPSISGAISSWNPASAYDELPSYLNTSMFDQGGYEGLGIGNPSSYTSVPTAENGGWLDSLNSQLQSAGKFFESPGGKLAAGLGGAGISALGAMKQNKLLKEAQRKQAEALAARQAQAEMYSAPLRLANQRTSAAPTVRRGESEFFTNNRIPSYFAEGGLANIRKYAQGRDVEKLMREAEDSSTPVPETSSRRSMGSEADAYAAETARLEAQALAEAMKKLQKPKKNFLGFCEGGALGYVRGGASGQADTIDAKVSDGEYVIDSDVVSALGDGNNEAGAAALDHMREKVRTHKRAAPKNKIPPKAKSPLEYMKSKGAK